MVNPLLQRQQMLLLLMKLVLLLILAENVAQVRWRIEFIVIWPVANDS